MTKITIFVFVLATTFIGLGRISASEPEAIAWIDLVPGKVFEDPFEKLNDEQLQNLSYVVRVRTLLAQEKLSPEAPDVEAASKAERLLREQGVDIGWLMSQRDRVRQLRASQAQAVEPSLDGKHIALAGYVIPVRSTKGHLTEFFLVSSIDACSHASPPPPNQIICVQLSEGIANADRRTPVLVTGSMRTERRTKKLLRGTGPTDITAAYSMSAVRVEVHSASK